MNQLNKDLMHKILSYMSDRDTFLFFSSVSGKKLDISSNYRSQLFRKFSLEKFKKSIKYYHPKEDIITYMDTLRVHGVYSVELKHILTMYIIDLVDCLLEKHHMESYTLLINVYTKQPVYRKKMAYSTGFQGRVFIQDHMWVCAVYGCRMMGSARRRIIHSNTLKALVG